MFMHIRLKEQSALSRTIRSRLQTSSALVLIVSFAFVFIAASCQDELDRQTGAEGEQATEHNGIEMRLSGVDYLPDRTVLTLDVTLHDLDAIEVDTVLPIPPDRIGASGVTGDPAMFGTERHYGIDGNTQRLDLAVGPVESHESGATVDIAAIGVQSSDGVDGYEWVEGPWSFELYPEEADIVDWRTVELPDGQVEPDAEIYVNLRQVRVSDAGVSIDYVIVRADGVDPLPIGQEVYLELPDGTTVDGAQRVAHGQSASEGGSMLFPPLPDGVESFTVAFGDFVVAKQGPVEVSFALSQPADTTGERVEIDLNAGFAIEDEQLQVSKVVLAEPGDDLPAGGIEIHVQSAMDDGDVSLRFVGPNTTGQALSDNLGNRYEAAGGSVGFEPDERGVLTPAGTSVVRFDDVLDPRASELTLSGEYYGRVVEGREPLTFEVPLD